MRLPHFLALGLAASSLHADPLSKSLEIDFFREVPNRNLKALAVRSDGRVLSGPTQRELPGKIPADLLWSIAPTTDARAWLIGTGPEGKVFRVNTATATAAGFATEEAIDLEATHVFAVCPIDDVTFLAGTSPQGTVSLVRSGKVIASVVLPADSVFDFALVPGNSPAVLIATGNPGRIYRLDLAKFEQSGETKGKPTADELAKIGVTTFGEIRDRNIRRLLPLADGRVIAGSAPKGNVYSFPAAGGAPLLLLENREAEVTDLLADTTGTSFYAAITFSGSPAEARVNRPPTVIVTTSPLADASDTDAAKSERFPGRGQLIYFPAGGLPETAVSRNNTAFYRLAWHDDANTKWVLLSGGEQGELLAYSPAERRSINLGASASAQVNAILPSQPKANGLFHLMRNNPAGLSQLNFADTGERSLETRKLDLGVAAEIGQVRFAQISGPVENLRVALRTSFGSDELEGWSEWTTLQPLDGGWFAPNLRGRYVQLRVTDTQKNPTPLTIDKAALFYLPQNRRPQLADFRIFPVNLGLVPVGEANPAVATTTLGQLLFPNQREAKDEIGAKRKGGLLNSPIVPSPGAQIVYWALSDADDDNLAATFAITPEGRDEWTDLAVNTSDSFVQFEVSHLPEGRYRSRLTVREQAPRPEAQRLSYTFETDVLTVDRGAPEIIGAAAERVSGAWRVTIEGKDALSLLEGAEFTLNNGARATLEHPADGILDSRRETFVAEFIDAKASAATSVEITLYDKSGNSASRRLPLK